MTEPSGPSNAYDGHDSHPSNAPTVAEFSPVSSASARSQSSILIHQKSPLLIATPPQVIRALAYSHPFILSLNRLAGLLSWTTGDPWESFLLVATFWFIVIYGDAVTRWAGPVVLVVGLIFGIYTRRYSPLASTAWTGHNGKHKRKDSDQQRRTLDEILETLQEFTSRCGILLDPSLRLTDFLSTQQTATKATTRPALTALFVRILFSLPVWIILALPPLRIITTQRVALFLGTLGLSWHSRPARVSRTILWRSRTIRRATSLLTGLSFSDPPPPTQKHALPTLPPRATSLTSHTSKGSNPGVRFTFTLLENQRRWLGLGWTANMLAYERANWTDEHLEPASSSSKFALPDTESETTKWRWVPESEWHIEGAQLEKEKSARRIGGGGGGDGSGWAYYDNKWRDGRKADGWGRYTRRRKWFRDAELVEVTSGDTSKAPTSQAPASEADAEATAMESSEVSNPSSYARKRTWLSGQRPKSRAGVAGSGTSACGSAESGRSARSRDGPLEDVLTPINFREKEREWSMGEGVAEGLG